MRSALIAVAAAAVYLALALLLFRRANEAFWRELAEWHEDMRDTTSLDRLTRRFDDEMGSVQPVDPRTLSESWTVNYDLSRTSHLPRYIPGKES